MYEIIDACQCFKEALTGTTRYWGNRILFENNASHECKMNGDGYLLGVAFSKLMENAVKASPMDLPVSVKLDTTRDRLKLVVRSGLTGSLPSDTGQRHRKFFNGSNDLEILLIRSIAELHDGFLKITADESGDVVATISLPLTGTTEGFDAHW